MNIRVASSAGFCDRGRRAVDIAERAAAEGECWCLGELIHNRHETGRLEKLGIRTAKEPVEVPAGARVLIRSHGEPDAVYRALEVRNCRIVDATCPNVSRIHRLVREAAEKGRIPVVIGDRSHPEVRGICGSAEGVLVFQDEEEIAAWLEHSGLPPETPFTVVFQTTEIRSRAKKTVEILKKVYTNTELFDTICEATFSRQKEAVELAAICDAMLVVGDRSSANTRRLAEICRRVCPRVIFAETASESDLSDLIDVRTLGVTAGASTPAWIIEEVCSKMTEEIKNEINSAEPIAEAAPEAVAERPAEPADESFDALLEKSFKTLNTGDKVVGIVASIGPNEVTVDLGTKHSGYIPISELTDDPDLKPEDVAKVGEEIETFVMRVNDVEGTVQLSKKRLDTVKNWDSIEEARENRIPVEGLVTEENKGGIVVNVKGIRVFVPASQTGLPKDAPMSSLLKTRVQLRITEVNHSRRRVVGSIRAVQYEARKAAADKTWAEIEVGKTYTGTVKSLTSYGAFVDIGGVDGMVHVSELSWKRVHNPAEVLKVGDVIEVHVLSFDKEKKKISLGYRKAEDNPWNKFTEAYQIGSVATVKIVKLMAFGAFAEIVPGVDGLIHVSQITNERRIGKPDEVLSEGQTVDVKITNIDYDNKKISLSIKALMEGERPAAPAFEDSGEDAIVYDTDAPQEYSGEEE